MSDLLSLLGDEWTPAPPVTPCSHDDRLNATHGCRPNRPYRRKTVASERDEAYGELADWLGEQDFAHNADLGNCEHPEDHSPKDSDS